MRVVRIDRAPVVVVVLVVAECIGGGAAAATRAPCQSPTRRPRLPLRASARPSAAAAARARARRGRRQRGQGHVQVDRTPVDVVVLFVAFDRSFSWLVWGKFGRWRWRMLVECAHAPICCGCYVFLFIFLQSPRTGETQSMTLRCPQSRSIFDRRLWVSGALFFFWWRAGGAFLGNWVVGDGRCLSSVPTRLFDVADAWCCCSFFS